MKLPLSLITLFLLVAASAAQSRPITSKEYEKVFQFAVSETNSAFPFVFTVTTTFVENGKVVSTFTEVHERESQLRERTTRTTVKAGKTTKTYQVSIGSENAGLGEVYCSDDGVTWKPPSPYECSGPVSFYGRRNRKSVEYSAAQKSLAGKTVRIYREYSVFTPLTPNAKKDFRDEVSTIDSRGFFMSIVTTEGTLRPRKVTLVRKQFWDTQAKIKPVVAPIK